MNLNTRELWRLIIVSTAVVVADQASKALIRLYLPLYGHVTVIDNFFNLNYVLNPGGVFGLFANQSDFVRKGLFLFLSSLTTLLILWFYTKVATRLVLLSYGLALIFGGAVGNLIDRFRLGNVVDFLDFYIYSFHWPSFNIADSAISIGMIIIGYHIALKKMIDL